MNRKENHGEDIEGSDGPLSDKSEGNSVEVLKGKVAEVRRSREREIKVPSNTGKKVYLNEDCSKVVCSFLSSTDRWDLLRNAIDHQHHPTITWILSYDRACSGPVRFKGKGFQKCNAMTYSISSGNIDILDYMLSNTDIHELNESKSNAFGCTVLHTAVYHHQVEVVKKLLTYPSIDINAQNTLNGFGALSMAISNGYSDIVAVLLKDERIDVNSLSCHEYSPLLLAIHFGRIECAELVLSHPNVDINYKMTVPYKNDKAWKGALVMSIGKCQDSVVKLIMDRQDLDRKLYTSAIQMARYTKRLRVLETLLVLCGDQGTGTLKFGPVFDIFVDQEKDLRLVLGILHDTPIPKEQSLSLARTILERHILTHNDGINARDLFGESVLMWAASNGYLEFMYILCEYDTVDVNQPNNCGSTALIMAIANKRSPEVVRFLLEREDVDVNVVNNYGFTALHWAIRNGSMEILEMLLTLRPEVILEGLTSYGTTAYHMAACQPNSALLHRLLQHERSNVNIENVDGDNLLMIAAKFGCIDIVTMLLEDPHLDLSTIAVDCSESGGKTSALSYASLRHDRAMVVMLLEYMIRHHREKPDIYIGEVLVYAALHGLVEMVRCLLAGKDLDGNDLGIEIDVNRRRLLVPPGQEVPDLHYSHHSVFWRVGNGDTALMCACNRKSKKGYAIGHSWHRMESDGGANLSTSESDTREVIRLLLSHPDIDINAKNEENNSAILMAIDALHDDACQLLVLHNLQEEGRGGERGEILDITGGICLDHSALLLPSHPGAHQGFDNAIHKAAKTGNVHFLRLAYDHHLSAMSKVINARNNFNKTALTLACDYHIYWKNDERLKEIVAVLLAVPGVEIEEHFDGDGLVLLRVSQDVKEMFAMKREAVKSCES